MSSWEWQAQEWLAWARTPGHDSYWLYRDLFVDAIVPAPGAAPWRSAAAKDGSPATWPASATRWSALTPRRPWSPGPPTPTRVLVPGGRLCVCITHPTAEAGKFESKEPDARFVITGSYLGSHRREDLFERDGLRIAFAGWRHSLEEYARALEDAGLLIDRLREPPAPAAALAARPGFERWQRLPSFLHLRAVKPA